MAWDTARTKSLLLEAAIEEFSEFGLAGARMDKISCRAGVNKERIYQYFGKKTDLFGAAFEHVLVVAETEVPLTGSGPEAVGDFAGRLFDYHNSHPQLARFTYWEGLERTTPAARQIRSTHNDAKARRLQTMLPGLPLPAARELLQTALSLASSWIVLRGLDDNYEQASTESRARRDRQRRKAIVAAVTAAARDAVSTTDAGSHEGVANHNASPATDAAQPTGRPHAATGHAETSGHPR